MTSLAYRPDIDGLRAIAVLAVVINHLNPHWLPGGYVGVDIFFVISGYLITRIILTEVAAGQFTLARFYERRVRRIIPALFVMLLSVLVAGWFIMLPSDYLATLKALASTVLFSSNLFFWREEAAGYFAATDTSLNPLLHTWSLGVEEQFYVAFPLLALLIRRWRQSWQLIGFVALAIISLALAMLLIDSKSVAVFFLTPFRAWELLAGSVIASQALPRVRSRVINESLGGLGMLAILWAVVMYSHGTVFPGAAALIPVLGASAIIYAGQRQMTIVGRVLSLKPMVWVGLISYSLYLWHWPLMVLIRYRFGDFPDGPLGHTILLGLSLLAAYLSWRVVETPLRKPATNSVLPYKLPAALAFLFILLCGLGINQSGFSSRVSQAVMSLDKSRDPEIPFLQCDEKFHQPCEIGNKVHSSADVFMFGDSHLLAWGPGLEHAMSEQGRRAFFIPTSGCPPLIKGPFVSSRKHCRKSLDAIAKFFQHEKTIKSVVMAANWNIHSVSSSEAISLKETVRYFLDKNIAVTVIGPVPTYKESIPFEAAKAIFYGHGIDAKLRSVHAEKNQGLFSVVKEFEDTPGFVFLNPVEWFCPSSICTTMENGIPLYRDDDHLSVEGALLFKSRLRVN